MKIKCLGGFREVGKNAVLLETKRENILLEYGLEIETGRIPRPAGKVDSVLLTHAHLDHVGSCPVLFKRSKPPIYSTSATFEQGHLILRDNMKVSKLRGMPQNYNKRDLGKMMSKEVRITYGQKFETKNSEVEVFDAGHIPGSCSFLINVDRKSILYTGDFNTNKTRLLNEAKIKAKNVDLLITESTYAAKEHPDRKKSEKQFLEIIESTLANDGIVLIPSFAIGRSAEVILTLDSFKRKFPVYLDGMAITATQIALKYPEFLRNYKKLRNALKKITFLRENQERRKALREPGVIVTTSGMMEGGPIIQYMKYLYNNPQSSIVFVGFLIPRTAGRYLLDTGRFVNEDIDLKVKMNIHSLDFSAHLGRSDLFNFIQKTNPEKIICLHGDHCQRFAMELRGRGFDAIAPTNGDSIDINRW